MANKMVGLNNLKEYLISKNYSTEDVTKYLYIEKKRHISTDSDIIQTVFAYAKDALKNKKVRLYEGFFQDKPADEYERDLRICDCLSEYANFLCYKLENNNLINNLRNILTGKKIANFMEYLAMKGYDRSTAQEYIHTAEQNGWNRSEEGAFRDMVFYADMALSSEKNLAEELIPDKTLEQRAEDNELDDLFTVTTKYLYDKLNTKFFLIR